MDILTIIFSFALAIFANLCTPMIKHAWRGRSENARRKREIERERRLYRIHSMSIGKLHHLVYYISCSSMAVIKFLIGMLGSIITVRVSESDKIPSVTDLYLSPYEYSPFSYFGFVYMVLLLMLCFYLLIKSVLDVREIYAEYYEAYKKIDLNDD